MNSQSQYAILTSDLSFRINKEELILNNLNLKVEYGSIYGFLGPNGAGKTTTIRSLLGLLPISGESITMFGQHIIENRIAILSRIGSLIELPSLYEHLSGRENLEITRIIRHVEKERVVQVLDLVKLSSVSHKKVRIYSLGMKQRN
jgi:lantibiotic transport system ATP-binding protein